jgi:hypothetical protein
MHLAHRIDITPSPICASHVYEKLKTIQVQYASVQKFYLTITAKVVQVSPARSRSISILFFQSQAHSSEELSSACAIASIHLQAAAWKKVY